MSEAVIVIHNLSVQFGAYYALKDIHLEIAQGSFTAVVGPNGAGKSTLLKTLLGIIKAYQGTVSVFGKKPESLAPQWIGYVPQVKSMDRTFPARAIELVLTGLKRRWPWHIGERDKTRVLEALEKVDALNLAYRPLANLSGGELQRIYLARSLARQPKLILLDEPATGVDKVGEKDFYKLLESYQKEQDATIMMVTHDWHAATHHARQVLLLNHKQVSFGPPHEALKEDNLRMAYGHIGHPHELRFLMDKKREI
jgi:zinc transport system ATP-binding protein